MTLLPSVFLLDIEFWGENFYLCLRPSKRSVALSLVPIVSSEMPARFSHRSQDLAGIHFLLRLTLQFLFNSLASLGLTTVLQVSFSF